MIRILFILFILLLLAKPAHAPGHRTRVYLPWTWPDLDTYREEIADTVIWKGDTLALIRIVEEFYFLRRIEL